MKTKKFFIKKLPTVLMLVAFFLLPIFARAEEKINDIQIDVLLNDDGSANITQIWDIETHKGTEFYITMSRMGDMEVQNFRVKDETGKEFTFVGEWDTSGSIKEKAYKNGFNPIGGGFEMCWGKGSYGKHTYTLSYTLTNLVKSYPDSDGFNTRFINDQMNPNVDNATVRIRFADETKNQFINAEQMGIWAFGHDGRIEFIDNEVVAQIHSPITQSQYLNVMMRLDKNIIQPVSQGSGTFEELKNRAFENSDYVNDDAYDHTYSKSGGGSFTTLLMIFVFFMPFAIFTTVFMVIVKSVLPRRFQDKNIIKQFLAMGGSLKNANYSRELPMNGSLSQTQWALNTVGAKIEEKDILNAYILRLIQKKALIPLKEETENFFGFTRERMNFNVDRHVPIEDRRSKELLEFIAMASGGDLVLEEKEMKKWARKNYSKFEDWFERVRSEGKRLFREQNGYTTEEVKKSFSIKYRKHLTPQGFTKIQGAIDFKSFLEDFTLIAEREAKEVELWDEYLIFAALFGIADKVSEQMESLYPDFAKESSFAHDGYTIGSTLAFSSGMREAMYSGYQSGMNTSSSSGGGGFSSSGGGGGFSGGGSGGGSR